MIVDVIKPVAHCSGVINAIEIAKQVAKENKDKHIYVFGLLVHNEDVSKDLEKIGIETIDITKLDPIERLKQFGKDDLVIFTAHGHPKKYEDILNANGVQFVDTTCKKVKQSFNYVREAKEVIYIGKKNHPEAMSALTMNDNVHFYDVNIGDFNYNQVITPNPLVINQTTLSFLELKDIHQEILNHIPNANIIDEICDATYLRQKAIASLKDDVDAIIVIGSKRSSNTLKLYELSLELHPSKKVIFVENIGDLKGFSLDFSHVALASGTSTPYQTVMEIKEYLERA